VGHEDEDMVLNEGAAKDICRSAVEISNNNQLRIVLCVFYAIVQIRPMRSFDCHYVSKEELGR
jgi:hypothetical protein